MMKFGLYIGIYVLYWSSQVLYGIPCFGPKQDRQCVFCNDVATIELECKGENEVIDLKRAVFVSIPANLNHLCENPQIFLSETFRYHCRRPIPLAICQGRRKCTINAANLFRSMFLTCELPDFLRTLHVSYSCYEFQQPAQVLPSNNEEAEGRIVYLLSPNFPCNTPADSEYRVACRIVPQGNSNGRENKIRLTGKLIDLSTNAYNNICPEMLVVRKNEKPVMQLCSGASVMNMGTGTFKLNSALEIGYLRTVRNGIGGRFWITIEGINTQLTVTCEDNAQWLESYPEVPPDWDWENNDWWWEAVGWTREDDNRGRGGRSNENRGSSEQAGRGGRDRPRNERNGWWLERDRWRPDEPFEAYEDPQSYDYQPYDYEPTFDDLNAWSPQDYSWPLDDQFPLCTSMPTSNQDMQNNPQEQLNAHTVTVIMSTDTVLGSDTGSDKGRVLAGVLGGLASLFVVLGIILICFMRYRRQRRLDDKGSSNVNNTYTGEPLGVSPSAPMYEPTNIYTLAAPIDDHYSTPTSPIKNGSLEIKSAGKYEDVVFVNPTSMYAKLDRARGEESDIEKNADTDETIMNENDELYEPSEEIEEIRKNTTDDVIMQEHDDVYEGPIEDEDANKADKLPENNQKYEDLVRKEYDKHNYESLANKTETKDKEVKDNDSVTIYENNELYSSSLEDEENDEDDDNERKTVVLPKPMSNDPGSRQSFV